MRSDTRFLIGEALFIGKEILFGKPKVVADLMHEDLEYLLNQVSFVTADLFNILLVQEDGIRKEGVFDTNPLGKAIFMKNLSMSS